MNYTTTHSSTHTHTHAPLFQSTGAGSKAGIPGGCCGLLWLSTATCTEGHRRARRGLDGRWAFFFAERSKQGRNMHRLRSADSHIDGKDCSGKTTEESTTAASHRVIALPTDVMLCKWRFTCDIKNLPLPEQQSLRKQGQPDIGRGVVSTIRGRLFTSPKGGITWLVMASYSSSAVVIFPSKITILFRSVCGYIPSDYPFPVNTS